MPSEPTPDDEPQTAPETISSRDDGADESARDDEKRVMTDGGRPVTDDIETAHRISDETLALTAMNLVTDPVALDSLLDEIQQDAAENLHRYHPNEKAAREDRIEILGRPEFRGLLSHEIVDADNESVVAAARHVHQQAADIDTTAGDALVVWLPADEDPAAVIERIDS